VIKGPGGAIYGESVDGGVAEASGIRAGDSAPVTSSRRLASSAGFAPSCSGAARSIRRSGLACDPDRLPDRDGQRQYFYRHWFVANPTLTLKLGPKTTLLLEEENMQLDLPQFANANNGTGTATNAFNIADSAQAPNGSFYGTLIPGKNPVGQRYLTTPNQEDFRWDGPDTYSKRRYRVSTIRLDEAFTPDLQAWIGYNYAISNVKQRSFNITLRNANDSAIPLSIRTNPQFLALLRPAFGSAQPQVLDYQPASQNNDVATVYPTVKGELFYRFTAWKVENRFVFGASEECTRQGQFSPDTNFYYGTRAPATRSARLGRICRLRHPLPLPQSAGSNERQALGFRPDRPIPPRSGLEQSRRPGLPQHRLLL